MLAFTLALACSGLGPAAAASPAAGGGFRFADVNDKSLGLWEGDQPVLVYNHGVLSRTGVPADRNRSTYIHPLYGLDGEVLTDDFPKDHYHHRGLFWAWPHVKIDGKEYSTWDLKGIEQRFERWLEKKTEGTVALLSVANGWYVGAQRVMEERVQVRVHPAKSDERAIDLDFTWIPIGKPITLTGAEGKSYGGLTLRFAPGTNTVITIPSGPTARDLPMTNLPWADLTRLWSAERKTSGAALFVHPSHPDFPPQWLTRHYGVLCLGWPGVQPATFPPGKPIHCRYRVLLHRGVLDPATLEAAYRRYAITGTVEPQPK